MKLIGLTGPTGAGKSSLTPISENLGFQVIDCDKIARKAVEKNTQGLKAVVKAFGEDILTTHGELNRKALAKKAFSSAENTKLLNKTLLPFIVELVLKECKSDWVLLDAPTLIESGLNKKCDVIISVLAEREIRLKRICDRDGITVEEAELRINAGKSDEFYIENSNYTIYNNGDTPELDSRFSEILREIKER